MHASQDKADVFFPSFMQLASEILKSSKLLACFHSTHWNYLLVLAGLSGDQEIQEAERELQMDFLTISPFNVVIVRAKFPLIQRYLEELYKRLLNQKKVFMV